MKMNNTKLTPEQFQRLKELLRLKVISTTGQLLDIAQNCGYRSNIDIVTDAVIILTEQYSTPNKKADYLTTVLGNADVELLRELLKHHLLDTNRTMLISIKSSENTQEGTDNLLKLNDALDTAWPFNK